MRQPVRRVGRLLEAAGRRAQIEQKLTISLTEYGVIRALASAFGKPPPPLMLEVEEDDEGDVRREYVLRMVQANQ